MGMFDDLIPQGQAPAATGGMFDDLIPQEGVPAAPAPMPTAEPEKGAVLGSDVAADVGDMRPPLNYNIEPGMNETGGGGGWGKPPAPMDMVLREAVSNVPKSAVNFAKNMAQPFIHPVDTAKSLGHLVMGTIGKVIPGVQEDEKYADAVGQFFAERYGGIENLKKTIAEDPVGFAADASAALGLTGSVMANAPGRVGQIGNALKTASNATNPINAGVKAVKGAAALGGKAAAGTMGLFSGRGGKAYETVARAGMEGGESAAAAREAFRGAAPVQDVVDDAFRAVSNMRASRGAQYRSGMANIARDKSVLDFKDIGQTLKNVSKIGSYKGQTTLPKSQQALNEVVEAVKNWKGLDPKEFHTPEGMDALKRSIGDIMDHYRVGSPEYKIVKDTYDSVKRTIMRQAPEYGKIMQSYDKASDLIKEAEKTLSVNRNASVDTTLRKLLSVMRNNVNTNYGRRVDLGELLVENGAPHLMEKLAGQTLNAWTPSGMARYTNLPVEAALGYFISPWFWATIPLSSPRLGAESAYYAGRAVGGVRSAARALPAGSDQAIYQAGRVSREGQP